MEVKEIKRFKFFGNTYTIKYVDVCPLVEGQEDGAFNRGMIEPSTSTIYIATKDGAGKSYSKDRMDQTLRHELMHMVFLEGQYIHEYDDEPIVEWCAKAIGELLNKHVI